MHRNLMDILACPVCKAELELTATKEEGGEVIEGVLVCTKCGERYPIEGGVPNLLPPAAKV